MVNYSEYTADKASEIYYKTDCFGRKVSKKDLKVVAQSPYWATEYAKNVLKARWDEAEKNMLDDDFLIKCDKENEDSIISVYCDEVVKGRWKELEEKILKLNLSSLAFDYARYIINGRWEEAEHVIAQNAKYAYQYALHPLEGRFELAEETIKKDPEYATLYATEVINKRWREAEPYILENAEIDNCMDYLSLLKDRWLELENKILNKSSTCMRYVKITKKRWPEFEKRLIKLSPKKISQYFQITGKVSEDLHNKMVLLSFNEEHKDVVNEYFENIEDKKKKYRRFLNKVIGYISQHKDKNVEQVLDILGKEEYSHIEESTQGKKHEKR